MNLTPQQCKACRRVTVMGLGLFGGGGGVARYFARLGAKVTVTDLATPEKLARSVQALAGLDIEFVLGKHRPVDFQNADLIVTNQAVRPDNPYLSLARAAGIPIVTETGLALALNRSPWLGVSGSSGKSTTSGLIAEILRQHNPDTLFGGNIGGDLLTRVESHSPAAPLVVELSSFQLIHIGPDLAAGRVRPPRVAVLTNLTPNHLDWHVDFAEYAAAKQNLLSHQNPGDYAVLNLEDPGLTGWADAVKGRLIRCGRQDPGGPDAAFLADGAIVLRLDGREGVRFPLDRFRLLGDHNRLNAVQAAAAAYACIISESEEKSGAGIGAEAIVKGLEAFQALPHRLERVAAPDQEKLFVNDSKSTTPEAAITALQAIDKPITLIAGGYDKHSPFEALAAEIQARATALVLVGAAGKRLGDAVRAAADQRPAGRPELTIVDAGEDFKQAFRKARELTPRGGVVLLSPACASYGMFVNYEERGEVFKKLALEL